MPHSCAPRFSPADETSQDSRAPPVCSLSRKPLLKLKYSIPILLGLVFIWNGQLVAAAQDRETRPPQDFFHSVKKTTASPFAPAVDPAIPNVKTIGTNLKAFGVPFKINASNDSFIEVQLYLSRDMGSTWKFHSRQSTDRNDFPFQADEDGEYWFSLKTLDRDRRLLPEGDPQAELKIVVDTVKPTLDFRIETDAAGRVVCRWNAQDKNLSTETFQIYYQPIGERGPTQEWRKVPVELKGKARVGVYADQIAWWPETSDRQLNVAVEIRDIAGNVAQARRQVVVPQSAWRHRSQSVAQITDSNSPRLPSDGTPVGERPFPQDGLMTSQAESNQVKAGLTTSPEKTAHGPLQRPANGHPPNVVCENGVCQIVPTQLIGSEVELADPPKPDQDPPSTSMPPRQSAQESGAPPPSSLIWQSDPQEQISRNRSSMGTTVGSTMRPDPWLAPQINPMQTMSKPVTNIPSNPGTMKNVGDQVIGESSTMGRSNQYRGLNSRDGSELPRPTLLPGERGNQTAGSAGHSTASGYPENGRTEFNPPSGEFSSASFPNPGSINTQSKEAGATSPSMNEGQARTINNYGAGPLQIIGTKRFRLDYGIDAIDPSGVARVDLWMTRDGRNWNAWGRDPDNQSPFPVEVQNDGSYGFRIVVHSQDGLTGQGPSTGDEADMWVLVDTQSPLAQISSVPYGRGEEAGRLVINYSVVDDQLALRPVTISYADSPQGPWNLIAEGLRNESRYVWKPNSEVPDQIYLRIEAVDKAGNVGVHVLNQAIDVSGLVPRGTIRGVSPVGR